MRETESEWDSVLELEWSWSYTEATKTLPYVRSLLRSLRECYIACWHFFLLNGRDPDGPAYRRPLAFHRDEGVAVLEELQRMRILPYQNPLRGIALFPFHVYDESGKPQDAYYVYKDSRDAVDSFVSNHDLCFHHDLYAWERPIPHAWKTCVPVMNLEGQS